MKLQDILGTNQLRSQWESKGYLLPEFDIKHIRKNTYDSPTWVHFGAGNIFRAFPATILNDALNTGKYNKGVIVAETYDYDIIDQIYQPYDNLSLNVSLKSSGTIEKKVIASVTESLKADPQFSDDWDRLKTIFRSPSLQMVSFTITEKGYRGPAMDKLCELLYERFLAGRLPLTLQSMDNCSHNGDVLKENLLSRAENMHGREFLDYLSDVTLISYPWSMIDKITPRPHPLVAQMLAEDGFEDNIIIETDKHTFTAPFVNAEEVQYLVCEDNYTNGRPPLDLGGVLYTSRETVDKVETMKVTTCLNPLHTSMALFGCLLGYTSISEEMADDDIRNLVLKLGYMEAMPVVTDPGVINPYEFIGDVVYKRLPNPFMPDTPQRIAMDTSQKLPIRFGETIKKYLSRGMDMSRLTLIPLTLAAYARYLCGIDDQGNSFTPSPDPMLASLQALVAPLSPLEDSQDFSRLRKLYSRSDIFGVNLCETSLMPRIEQMVRELFAGKGAVRNTLHKYVK